MMNEYVLSQKLSEKFGGTNNLDDCKPGAFNQSFESSVASSKYTQK